jgi:psiF repeat
MKFASSSLFALVLSVAIGATSAFAADAPPAKTLTPQQQKMKDCNASATTQKLTGDDRKAFMSNCLKANSTPAAAAAPTAAAAAPATQAAPAAPVTQQQKMKNCNADATSKNLTGDDRKAYMSTCLKGSPAPAAQ